LTQLAEMGNGALEADMEWVRSTNKMWETSKEAPESGFPFVVCNSNGSSGYERGNQIRSLLSSSVSHLADLPISNSAHETCYYVTATHDDAKRLTREENIVLQPLTASMKVRKGTVSSVANAFSKQQQKSDVRAVVTLAPGYRTSNVNLPNIQDSLSARSFFTVNQEMKDTFPFSVQQTRSFDLSNVGGPKTVVKDMEIEVDGSNSLRLSVPLRSETSEEDVLSLVAGLAAMPQVLSIEIESSVSFF